MLMRSVSGVRGIVGRDPTPDIAVRHTAAFGTILKGGHVVVARRLKRLAAYYIQEKVDDRDGIKVAETREGLAGRGDESNGIVNPRKVRRVVLRAGAMRAFERRIIDL